MRKIILISFFVFTTAYTQTKYEKGMIKALNLWKNNKPNEASAMFERIATAEKSKWIPAYYVATIEILTSFGLKNEVELNEKLKKAQKFLSKATSISENNPEIIIVQALLNTAYISFDGQKYGMLLSAKNTSLYKKALELAPKNPRVILGKAEWDMGAAQFFGKSIKPYCKEIKRALELFKKEELPNFYPTYGKERAKEILKKCVE